MKKYIFAFCFMMVASLAMAKESAKIEQEFFINNKTYVCNNEEFKFYAIEDNEKRMLSKEEVQELFPEYKIILISEFDKERKYRMKNSLFKSKKVLILNDRKRTFYNFFVYPESSRNELAKGQKAGLIKPIATVYGKKNIRLKHFGGDEFEIVVR